jgi:hypothetical protein
VLEIWHYRHAFFYLSIIIPSLASIESPLPKHLSKELISLDRYTKDYQATIKRLEAKLAEAEKLRKKVQELESLLSSEGKVLNLSKSLCKLYSK